MLVRVANGAWAGLFGLMSNALEKRSIMLVHLSWGARLGLLGLIVFAGSAIFAPWVAPYGPDEVVGDVWEPISAQFWLGTDQIGRDLLTRLIYGARNTFFVAGAATLLSFFMGSFLGFLAAVRGGIIDQSLSRLNDLMMAIPTLIFALVVLSVLPVNMLTLILVMGVLDSTRVFRLSRAVAVDIAVLDFVEAARLRGEKTLWIIFREILPNALTPLFAEFGLRFAFAVLFLSTLSFLGLGIQPPEADWGSMVKENKDGIVFGIPAALIPAGAIAILTISINLVVDSILSRTTSLKGGRG
ncbi:ABC transporter permease [Motiliproteus sp. MSK22-1]|uniref:ABC transporter permease n=1 Tax=Motiliproteus sp. MSK22-1 TaxID=1897630 RepID=UPI001E5820AA|nr:ABC transporter permease [Motiliproteus sp. MSK22-1]